MIKSLVGWLNKLKLQKIMENKIIGTHNGRFHCDEVMACMMLRKYTEQFKDAKVVRTRDDKVLAECNVVVDVGGKYDPPYKLDHHQIEFQNTFPNHNIRMSSAGLVYLHYPQIIKNILKEVLKNQKEKLNFQPVFNQAIVTQIYQSIYRNFIIYVDANDNGIDKVNQKDVAALPTTLWSRIGKINPMWWDQTSNQLELFHKAMQVADEELYSQVRQTFLGSIQTKSIVQEAFEKRKQVDESGKIMVLKKYVPWQKPLVQLQEESKCEGQILFVVFPDKSGGKWRIQAVSAKEGSFDLRKGLKEEWRGIKDGPKLIEISNIDDIDFVHASGFIGGASSFQSTIKMGKLSI